MNDQIEVEWHEAEDIEAIDTMVEQIDTEYNVKLFDGYLDTFSGSDKQDWVHECTRWIDNLINELESVKSEVKALEQ